MRALRDVRIRVDRLARRLGITVPRALVRDQLARKVALERCDDRIVTLASQRDVEHHIILRRGDKLLRRAPCHSIECRRMGGEILGDSFMLRHPALNALPLALHIRRDLSLNTRIKCPIGHEIAQQGDHGQQDPHHSGQ